MSIVEKLTSLGFTTEDDTDEAQVYRCGHAYVVVMKADPTIQAVMMTDDPEGQMLTIHFSRPCDELFDVLGKWSDVTPAEFN